MADRILQGLLVALEELLRSDAALARATEPLCPIIPFRDEPLWAVWPRETIAEAYAGLADATRHSHRDYYWQMYGAYLAGDEQRRWDDVLCKFGGIIVAENYKDVDFPIDQIDCISRSKSEGWTREAEIDGTYFRSIKEFAYYNDRRLELEEDAIALLEGGHSPIIRSDTNLSLEYLCWLRRHEWQNGDGSHGMAAAVEFYSRFLNKPYRFLADVIVKRLNEALLAALKDEIRIFQLPLHSKDDQTSFTQDFDAVRHLGEKFGVSIGLFTRGTSDTAPARAAVAIMLRTPRDRRVAQLLENQMPENSELLSFLLSASANQDEAPWTQSASLPLRVRARQYWNDER